MDSAWTLTIAAAVAYSIACCIGGSYASSQVGRPEMEGGILGLVFGPFGIVVAALLPKIDRPKPANNDLTINPKDLAAEDANRDRYRHTPRKLMP